LGSIQSFAAASADGNSWHEADLNLVINWLKHGGVKDEAEISEFEAVIVIARAITKFVAVYHQSCEPFEAFLKWGHANGHLPPLFR
jgi:hypothetical protein